MLELEGTTLGHYQLHRRLARGGMSVVYLATDQRLERIVALKVVERSRDEDMKQFQCEVKALGLLRHPHILPTFDSGEDGPYCYVAMPYIAGGTLRERLTKGPLNLQEARIMLEQVASALQCMHDHGLVHRDIKPGNILLRSEQYIYLADFGLAKEATTYSDISQTRQLIGTPEYLAPELAEEPASPASDIYALGIVLYQMLTGKLPFRGSTPIVVCLKHLNEQPAAPSLLNPAIPSAIEQVILCALEKDPRRRFPTVEAMAQAYQRALQAATSAQTIQHATPMLRYRARLKPVLPPARQASSLRKLHYRQGHPAIVALVATLFFAIAISLGTLASGFVSGGLRAQFAPTLNANMIFAQPQGTAQQALPPVGLTPTPTPSPKTSPSSNIDSGKHSNGPSDRPYSNRSGSSYSKVSGSSTGQSTGSGSGSGTKQSGGHKKGSGGGNGHGNGGDHGKGSGDGNGHGNGHGHQSGSGKGQSSGHGGSHGHGHGG